MFVVKVVVTGRDMICKNSEKHKYWFFFWSVGTWDQETRQVVDAVREVDKEKERETGGGGGAWPLVEWRSTWNQENDKEE